MTDPVRRLHVPSFSYLPYERTTISRVRRGFTFAPRYRSANKPADHRAFQKCARYFVAQHGLAEPYVFDNDGSDANDVRDDHGRIVENVADGAGLARRRRDILLALDRAEGPLDVIAYFGHGSRRGLVSAGIYLPHVSTFASHIASKANRHLVVLLYACRAGTPGGFAEQLATELLRRGVHASVFGHTTSGHTAWNPHKRRYPGGDWVIAPGDSTWSEWRHRLRDLESRFFARFPFSEPRDIVRELEGRPPAPTGRFH